MRTYRPLRAILFGYELLRLAAVLAMAVTGGAGAPVMPLASANTLFTLAAFFMLYSFERYKAYAPLYLAGKLIVVCSLTVWLFDITTFSGAEASDGELALIGGGMTRVYLIAGGALMWIGDLLTAALSFILTLQIRANKEQ